MFELKSAVDSSKFQFENRSLFKIYVSRKRIVSNKAQNSEIRNEALGRSQIGSLSAI